MYITTLITLPCTVKELESALQDYCDHNGKIYADDVFERLNDAKGTLFVRRTQLNLYDAEEIPSKTKGELNGQNKNHCHNSRRPR